MDGRLDMIVAILAQALMRLEALGAAQESVWLTELFVEDMDGQLRQEGIGEVDVDRHIDSRAGTWGRRWVAARPALGREAGLDETRHRKPYRERAPVAGSGG